MNARLIKSKNSSAVYIIVILIIVAAFFLLGGGTWIKGLSHGSRSSGMANLHWAQILIGVVIGFLLGLIAGKRKW